MRRSGSLDTYPVGRPLTADQITEFHAARLVLVIYVCGQKSRIDGLTKLAKLDFFVRYPAFFERVAEYLAQPIEKYRTNGVESAMVRHHYGPWDPRYYAVLAFLEGREVIQVTRVKSAFIFALTPTGVQLAQRLSEDRAYETVVMHIRSVKKVLGAKSGDALKKLVYKLFDEEVANLPLGETILP